VAYGSIDRNCAITDYLAFPDFLHQRSVPWPRHFGHKRSTRRCYSMRRLFLVMVRGSRTSMEKSNPPLRLPLETDRLVLRPSEGTDASRAIEILSDWEVSHMLARANFPPSEERIRQWFHEHRREWADGAAYRFAILRQARMIGLVDIYGLTGGEGTLGYWLERSAWGRGFASEAATAVVRFAFEKVRLSQLRAAHASDNEASSRVLRKLGFQLLDNIQRFSHSRREEIVQRRYILTSRAGSRRQSMSRS